MVKFSMPDVFNAVQLPLIDANDELKMSDILAYTVWMAFLASVDALSIFGDFDAAKAVDMRRTSFCIVS